MRLILVIAAIFVIVLTSIPAVIDGARSFRWGEDKEIAELSARLKNFPTRIGQWESLPDQGMGPAATDMLRPFASINRVYINASNQATAHVFILFGPTGPTAVHTPDVCFVRTDFNMLGDRRTVAVGVDGQNESKSFLAQFQSRDVNNKFLDSRYAWTVDGTWHAPEMPRFYFAANRFLFKIQIVAEYADRREMENNRHFEAFVAEIEKTLRNKVF